MSSEMIERVARTLNPHAFREDVVGLWVDRARSEAREKARAAIAAMREPTAEAMVSGDTAYRAATRCVGCVEPEHCCPPNYGGLDALVPAYRAMIDAALALPEPLPTASGNVGETLFHDGKARRWR